MARGSRFPRKLKAAADPRDCFAELAELGADVPGACAWGTAERGLTVNLGAGFDFGPLLTLGAPVVTAEVGAQLSLGGAQNLMVRLDRAPKSNKLVLSRLTGWSVKAELLVEAKLGIGIPEWAGEAAANFVPVTVPAGPLPALIEENSKANPLTEEQPEPAEPESSLDPVEGAEDRADAGMEAEEKEEEEKEEEAEQEEAPSEDADTIVDLAAVAKAEAALSLRYFIVRDANPCFLDGRGPALDKEMKIFISETGKALLKEEVEEALGPVTADASDTHTAERALEWLKLVPEDKWGDVGRAHIAALEARTQVHKDLELLATKALAALVEAISARYLFRWKEDSAENKLKGFLTSSQYIRTVGSASDKSPSQFELEEATRILDTYDPHATGEAKAAWKKRASLAVELVRQYDDRMNANVGYPKVGHGGMTARIVANLFTPDRSKTQSLLADLRRLKDAGESRLYLPPGTVAGRTQPGGPPSNRDIYDRVMDVLGAAERLKGWTPSPDSEAATTKTVVDHARRWIKQNAGLVTKPPERLWISNRKTVDLLAKVDAVLKNSPSRTELKALRDELDAAKRAERATVKTRAAQIVLENNGDLPAWPLTPGSAALLVELKKLLPTSQNPGMVKKLPADFVQVKEDLQLLMDEAADPQTATKRKQGLCYVSGWTFGGKSEVGASAKAKFRVGLGASELGVHAKAEVSAGFQCERVSFRLQGFEENGTTTLMHTQDVKISRWSAAATAFAAAKVGNKTVAEAEGPNKESGRIRWSAAMARWALPAEGATPASVALLPGSGVTYGRSAGRERFVEKLAALRLANQPSSGDVPPTADKAASQPAKVIAIPYVRRLSRALRVTPMVLARALLEMYPTDDALPEESHETLYFESRWAVAPNTTVKLRKGALDKAWQKFKKALRGRTTEQPPATPELCDLRKVLGGAFRKTANKTRFKLQSIAVRVRMGDDPEESEKTLFQVSWEYVVTATASTVRHTTSRTDTMPDVCTWWNLGKSTRVDRPAPGDAKVELWRSQIREDAVPAAFVVDV